MGHAASTEEASTGPPGALKIIRIDFAKPGT
jgi:hypothetical protein